MKIWLDDIRTPPDNTWTWCKSAQDFESVLQHIAEVTDISFDHDIASYDARTGDEITGYHCLCMIEKIWWNDGNFVVPRMTVHSANPVGRARMQKLIDKMEGR